MMCELTAFLSFFVNGFPDFVSSGGAGGASGISFEEDAFAVASASRSLAFEGPVCLEFPSSK